MRFAPDKRAQVLHRWTALSGLVWVLLAAHAQAAPRDRYPRAANLPGISGDYFRARALLIQRHYVPLRRASAWFIASEHCYPSGPSSKCGVSVLPEASCFADAPACVMLWRTPEGRILTIQTGGDDRRHIDLVQWGVPGEGRGYVAAPLHR